MQLGMIGLGRMGANMVRRLIHNAHSCGVFDPLATSGRRVRQRSSDRHGILGGVGESAGEAASTSANGAGGDCGRNYRRTCASPGNARHPDRGRQLLLRRRYPSSPKLTLRKIHYGDVLAQTRLP